MSKYRCAPHICGVRVNLSGTRRNVDLHAPLPNGAAATRHLGIRYDDDGNRGECHEHLVGGLESHAGDNGGDHQRRGERGYHGCGKGDQAMSVNACKAEKRNGEWTYPCTVRNARECHWATPMPVTPRFCAWSKAGACGQQTARRAALIVALEPSRDHTGDGNEMVGGSQP